MQTHVEGIKDLGCALKGYAEVFITLIARYLRFMYAESASEISLRYPLGDTRRDEERPDSAQVIQFRKFPSFQPLVRRNFLMQLQVEGLNRIDNALDLFIAETRLFQADSVFGEPKRFL